MRVDICEYSSENFDDVLKIENESFNKLNAEGLKKELSLSHQRFFVALDNGFCVGYLCLSLLCGEAEVISIAVRADYRNQKIGEKLLEFGLYELKKQNIDKVFLEVRESNTPAKKLYNKLGFNQISVRKNYYSFNGKTEDAIIMQKIL